MYYVIKRTDQGGEYVSKPGNKSSYTNSIRNMRKYTTKEEAESDKCPGNEVVIPLDSLY